MRPLRTLLIVFALAAAAMGCMSSEPAPRDATGQPTVTDWTNLVGWYRLDDGREALVTWSARGGLRLAGLAKPYFSEPFEPQPDGSFLWTPAESLARAVRFEVDRSGRVTTFDWTAEDNGSGTARRLSDQPYSLRELTYRNENVWLSGTLLIPNAAEPVPAAAMIHGSGDSDRDNLWYLVIADHLARQGVAVLLPDKRGCGKSSGDWTTAAMKDFAGDARAAVEAVRRHAGVDPARSGFLGVSQGGSIAPLAASMTPNLAFVVSISGGVATFDELLLHESRQTLRQNGLPGVLADGLAPMAAAMAKRQRPIWWKKNGDFDPLPFWRQLTVPKLLVFGAADEGDNVPVTRSLARLEEAQLSDLTLKIYPDSGHGLFLSGTRTLRPDFLELLATWIQRNSGPELRQ